MHVETHSLWSLSWILRLEETRGAHVTDQPREALIVVCRDEL